MRATVVRGVVESGSAKVDGKQGTATIRFAQAEDDPEADVLFRKIADGIVQHVSIGYRIYKAQKVEQAADTDTIPTYRAIDWEPFEISTVSIGEDAGAGFRGAATLTRNPCEFLERDVRMDYKYRHLTVEDADRLRYFQLQQAQSELLRRRIRRDDMHDEDGRDTYSSRRGRPW